MKLWYRSPAQQWDEGLPVGTGRLAAMVLGTFSQVRLALNHERLWKGVHSRRENEISHSHLPEIRRWLREGRYAEGTRAANEALGGAGGVSGRPGRVDPYQPAGDLYLEFAPGGETEYRRELDLETGEATISCLADGVRRITRIMAHLEEDRIFIRIARDGQPFDCCAWLDRVSDPDCRLNTGAEVGRLSMDGRICSGVEFRVRVDVDHRDGRIQVLDGRKLMMEGVREALLMVQIGVSGDEISTADELGGSGGWPPIAWEDLVQRQRREMSRHLGAMRLELDIDEPDAPTDERLRRIRAGGKDPALALLYFEYGRYLLCASSARASWPAHLQGKWNESLAPPWQSDYHLNINLQMNYWPAEAAGMGTCVEPLLRFLERMIPPGRKAAADLYGCRGVWFPLQTDASGRATPEAYGWAVWIGAAAWMAQHFWWRYLYSMDADELQARAYPFFKEVAAFYEDYLVEDGSGGLQIVPSQSPENRFVGGGPLPVSLGISSTLDILLARDAFDYAIRSSEILARDPDLRERWRDLQNRLPQLKIGRHGQLQEWNEDFEEAEPAHRHVSHLYGLFPGDRLDPERTPELWRAAEISLSRRLAAGGGHTGWSRAWTACLFARLRRPAEAWEHLTRLIADFATDSLLDLHPPHIFQIDGNFGGVAAVLEMLLQSQGEELSLLPALPPEWPSGRVTGLRARGGLTIGMEWRSGRLTRATIEACTARPCTLIHASAWRVTDARGQPVALRANGHRVTFDPSPGMEYSVLPDDSSLGSGNKSPSVRRDGTNSSDS
ncbi:MAG: glycoside hydrolase N-terminal domain-containing protein [Kiritimatiellia bacterium]|nr:glycoside hydrolase N-terminal domain-containing protein [Kiritimatiellia bacterium]